MVVDTVHGSLLIFFSPRAYTSLLSGPSREALKKSQTSHTWFNQEHVQLLKQRATRFFSSAMLPANCEGIERFVATSVIFLYPAGCILALREREISISSGMRKAKKMFQRFLVPLDGSRQAEKAIPVIELKHEDGDAFAPLSQHTLLVSSRFVMVL
jgi:hypothetical protein